jgi:hypothetical protein
LDEGVVLDSRLWDLRWPYIVGGLLHMGGIGRREDIGAWMGDIGRRLLLSYFIGREK